MNTAFDTQYRCIEFIYLTAKYLAEILTNSYKLNQNII